MARRRSQWTARQKAWLVVAGAVGSILVLTQPWRAAPLPPDPSVLNPSVVQGQGGYRVFRHDPIDFELKSLESLLEATGQSLVQEAAGVFHPMRSEPPETKEEYGDDHPQELDPEESNRVYIPVNLRAASTAPLAVKKKQQVIAYAVTITKDGSYMDGAAVLGESIRQAHLRSWTFSIVLDSVCSFPTDGFAGPSMISTSSPSSIRRW
jgi:hypothetical protein